MKANNTNLSLTDFSNFCTDAFCFRLPVISRKSNEVKYTQFVQPKTQCSQKRCFLHSMWYKKNPQKGQKNKQN